MLLRKDVKEFLEKHADLLADNKFTNLYEYAVSYDSGLSQVGYLTETFNQADINPLDYMNYVPDLYFNGTTVEHVVIPYNILRLNHAACAFCNIQTIQLHDDCELSSSCFYGCASLSSIKIPYIMNEVPEDCFYRCRDLSKVDLNSIVQISTQAFAHCAKLRDIFIPDDIEYIADDAFNDCLNLIFIIHKDNEYALNYAQLHNIKVKYL